MLLKVKVYNPSVSMTVEAEVSFTLFSPDVTAIPVDDEMVDAEGKKMSNKDGTNRYGRQEAAMMPGHRIQKSCSCLLTTVKSVSLNGKPKRAHSQLLNLSWFSMRGSQSQA